tara:strand:- start:2067 stop:2615 length:549 start_codon:yes stop_codon:yes gene_type:complete
MLRNFIYAKENFLLAEECDEIIKFFKKIPEKIFYKFGNYEGVYLNDDSDYLKDDKLSFLKDRFQTALNEYIKLYPELNFVKPFYLTEIRFKHWKANNFFDSWHSEHSEETPNRILNFMIYLSTHNCGTQFLDKRIIKSEKGKLVIMPSYFTHTHRGMPCPEKKDRYMIGGYFNFKNIKHEKK